MLEFEDRIFFSLVMVVILVSGIALSSQGSIQSVASGDFSSTFNTITGLAADNPGSETTETDTVNLQHGLQGYWRFDDPQVSRGYSLEFEGDDYVEVGIPVDQTSGFEGFTMAAWVYPTVDDGRRHVISTDNGGCDWSIHLDGDGKWNLFTGDTCGVDFHNVTLNKWQHVAAIYKSDDVIFCKNGDCISRGQSPGYDSSTEDLRIGDNPDYNENWKGKIDGVKVYERALTTSEVRKLYNGTDISEKKLELHQDFNEGPEECDLTSGTACLGDDSGNGNAGIPQNFSDNKINTGSGWFNQTPTNRPSSADFSGNGFQGRFYGGSNGNLNNFELNASSGWTQGRIGDSALEFDGSDDYVSVPDKSEFHGSDGWTISYWIKSEYYSGNYPDGWHGGIRKVNSTDYGYSLDYDGWGDDLDLILWDGSRNIVLTGDNDLTSNLDSWTHITATYDPGDEAVLYENGQRYDSAGVDDYGDISNDAPLEIGRDHDAKKHLNATLDDVRVYNRALDDTEVNSLYSGKRVEKGLVGEWRFESGEGLTAYDTSDFSRKGILGTQAAFFDGKNNFLTPSGRLNGSTISLWAKKEGERFRNYVVSEGQEYVDGDSREFVNDFYLLEDGSYQVGRSWGEIRNYETLTQDTSDSGNLSGSSGWETVMTESIETQDNSLMVDFHATTEGCNHHTWAFRILVDGEERGLVRQTDSDTSNQKMAQIFDVIDVSEGNHKVEIQWKLYEPNTYMEVYDRSDNPCGTWTDGLEIRSDASLKLIEFNDEKVFWGVEQKTQDKTEGSSWSTLLSDSYRVQNGNSTILIKGVTSAHATADTGNSWYQTRLLVNGNEVNWAGAGESNDGYSIASLLHSGKFEEGEQVDVEIQWREDYGGEFILDGAVARMGIIEFTDGVQISLSNRTSGTAPTTWGSLDNFSVRTEKDLLMVQSQLAAEVSNDKDFFKKLVVDGSEITRQSTGVSNNNALDTLFTSSIKEVSSENISVETEWYTEGGTSLQDSKLVAIGLNRRDYFNGSIDEVRIYNRSLSKSEIERLSFQ